MKILFSLLVLLACCFVVLAQPSDPYYFPYNNPDVDRDERVTQRDLTLIQFHYTANGLPYSHLYDMNFDGVIDGTDYLIARSFLNY